MLYVGVDVHKATSHVTVMDEPGRVLNRKRVPSSPIGLRQVLGRYQEPAKPGIFCERKLLTAPITMRTTMRAALYLRVSTAEQADRYSLPAQRRMLTEYCEHQGWQYLVYEDAGISEEMIEARWTGPGHRDTCLRAKPSKIRFRVRPDCLGGSLHCVNDFVMSAP